MGKACLFSILLLVSCHIRSQEAISIGSKYNLYSETLQEERTYWVHLPENYATDTAQAFPVVYLLDGESFFHTVVGISRSLGFVRGQAFPPSVIVGVVSTDRTRDFTPTPSASGRDGEIADGDSLQGGGSDTFTRFLTEELASVIETDYRTDGSNMLIGHSYAGLFVLNLFLHQPAFFDTYLAVDPSLWWDRGRLVQDADSLIRGKDYGSKKLYIGIASRKRTDRSDYYLQKANRFITEVLPQADNLLLFSKSFPEENHGTVAVPGIYDGIKQLFGK